LSENRVEACDRVTLVDSFERLEELLSTCLDPEVLLVARLVESSFEEVREILKTSSADGSTAGSCLLLAEFFRGLLSGIGVRSKVLQGDIEVSENSWLEHHVNLIPLTNHWILVDFSASQFDDYPDVPFLLMVLDPNKLSLKRAITGAYRWWIKT
jgi:hypothetical protein